MNILKQSYIKKKGTLINVENFCETSMKYLKMLCSKMCFIGNLCYSSDRVAVGRALDLPVYFGDAGSREVE